MNKTERRTRAFEFLYSLEMQKVDIADYEEQLQFFLENNEVDENKVRKYIEDIVYGIEKNKEEIIDAIKGQISEKWELARLSKVSISILKLAVYEMLYKDIPYKVVVNEAVELAKAYGDDNSPSFINGILASIITEKGIIQKQAENANDDVEGVTEE